MSKHFKLKLKWRRLRGRGLYHCFSNALHHPRRYESLCCNVTIKGLIGGAECDRPISQLRCARCDIEEMKLLGLEYSAEPSKKRKP